MDKGLRYILLAVFFILFYTSTSYALEFPLPKAGSNVVGKIYTVRAGHKDSLATLGREHDIGFLEMVEANPNLNPKRPGWLKKVVIPGQFILPNTKREGIVINLAELRIYYYPKNRPVVITMPIGIGMKGWRTPLMTTVVTNKKENPTWRVPASIRAASKKNGIANPPEVVPPGPLNPLGDYALRLGGGSYLIHGTRQPNRVGERVSAGCIRMYPEDIEQLFAMVPVGTPVKIIHQPYKVGRKNGQVFLEAHAPLSEYKSGSKNKSALKSLIRKYAGGRSIDWARAYQVANEYHGFPQEIDKKSLMHAENTWTN